MYTEIKEAVNFLIKHLLGRIPRRSVGLLAQELANYLAHRFSEMWDIAEPKKDEMNRVLRIKYCGQTDQLILRAAETAGLDLEEVLMCSPDNVSLFVNPGEVFYKCGDRPVPTSIWVGDVKADDDYSVLPAAALPSDEQQELAASPARGKKIAHSAKLHDSAANYECPYVELHLETVHPAAIDSPLSKEKPSTLKQFVFVPAHHRTYTVGDFAVTRFGCHRNRPDHEVMRRIQQQAAIGIEESPTDGAMSPLSCTDDVVNEVFVQDIPAVNNNGDDMKRLSVAERSQLIRYLNDLNNAERLQNAVTAAFPANGMSRSAHGSDGPGSKNGSPIVANRLNGMGDAAAWTREAVSGTTSSEFNNSPSWNPEWK